MTPPPPRKHLVEHTLELWLFRSRWLLAPFYVGLALTLAALVYAFGIEAWHGLSELGTMTSGQAIVMALSLIDLSLTGNLVLLVIFSGYENFVSKMEAAEDRDRPDWMGTLDFSGLKLKVMASLIAITGVALLRGYMQMYLEASVSDRMLGWLALLHITFVVSGLLLALTDWLAARTKHAAGH